MTDVLSLSGLRHLLDRGATAAPDELCQQCGAALAAEHRHVANVERRCLLCVCPACYASLQRATQQEGANRVVPRRYLRLPAASLNDEQWDAFEIPVGIAFFVHNSTLGRTVALYPSPAGATESLLSPDVWERVLGANPSMRMIAPDVEALLVRRTHDVRECYLVPVDACYELAGRIRRGWRGFGGGLEAREAIDAFFAMLGDKSEQASP
jgi:hypothetical protein